MNRVKIELSHHGQQLPLNYQYLVGGLVYRKISVGSPDIADRIHKDVNYKHLCFSRLEGDVRIDVHTTSIYFNSPPTYLIVSFARDEDLKAFVEGCFKEPVCYLNSGKHFKTNWRISALKILGRPIFFDKMRFRCVTPINLKRNLKGTKHAQHISPENPNFQEYLKGNMLKKHLALTGEDLGNCVFQFNLISRAYPKLIQIKNTKIKGYIFNFELEAPARLLETAYYSGFGGQNLSGGMGFTEIIDF